MDLINMMICVLAIISAMGSITLAKLAEPDVVQQPINSGLSTLLRKTRQSRCIRCYDDRYIDDGRNYNYGRNYYGSSYSGAGGSRSSYDDKSWYYPAERYENRGRYEDKYVDRIYGRYDDRYYPRGYDRFESKGYNDRYDWKSSPDFRGYGYDNQDRYNDRYNDGYYRDPYERNRGTYEGRYVDRDYYERYPVYPQRGGYDHKNYRPWDESYRGTSGFDNSGRGYYFAGKPNEQPPTSSIYRPSSQSSAHGRPYLPNAQSSPRPLQPPNLPPSSSPTVSSSSSSGPPHHYNQYNNRPSRPDDDSKGYAGGWGYVNDRDKQNEYNDRNKDTESSSYGVRPRPLGGSYLHDRDSNTPTAVNPIGGQDGKESNSQKPSTAPGSESNTGTENKMN